MRIVTFCEIFEHNSRFFKVEYVEKVDYQVHYVCSLTSLKFRDDMQVVFIKYFYLHFSLKKQKQQQQKQVIHPSLKT